MIMLCVLACYISIKEASYRHSMNMGGGGACRDEHAELSSSRHKTLCLFWLNAGPSSATLAQHQATIGAASRAVSPCQRWRFRSTDRAVRQSPCIEKYTAVQNQKAVTAYFSTERLLPFTFTRRYTSMQM